MATLMCLSRASGATLADYRHRVSEAIVTIQQLQETNSDEDPSFREQLDASTISGIREQLPASETVTIEQQQITVDNAWLHEALDEYQKIRGDKARSGEVLARAGERLLALFERLNELQKGAQAADKDASKGRLAEIQRRPEYDKKVAQGSAASRWWERFWEWFFSLFPKRKPLQRGSSLDLSGVALILVVALALASIAFLIWRFGPRYLRSRGRKKGKRKARIVLGEHLEPDQTAADLLALAERLARSGDLRAAIRKAYIAFLCELGDRKVISLAQHKTNRDYLNSVRGRASLHSSMRRLTNSFELHWYGFQPPGENDWNDFRAGYQQALKVGSAG